MGRITPKIYVAELDPSWAPFGLPALSRHDESRLASTGSRRLCRVVVLASSRAEAIRILQVDYGFDGLIESCVETSPREAREVLDELRRMDYTIPGAARQFNPAGFEFLECFG